jgi:hypothetical protein
MTGIAVGLVCHLWCCWPMAARRCRNRRTWVRDTRGINTRLNLTWAIRGDVHAHTWKHGTIGSVLRCISGLSFNEHSHPQHLPLRVYLVSAPNTCLFLHVICWRHDDVGVARRMLHSGFRCNQVPICISAACLGLVGASSRASVAACLVVNICCRSGCQHPHR